jgi:hypothetical protein
MRFCTQLEVLSIATTFCKRRAKKASCRKEKVKNRQIKMPRRKI